ncbi:MAG TPA: MlaD family protein [Opitutaceae bacterium]|nr:MlaD family protein [Opitutaceae bacterium]
MNHTQMTARVGLFFLIGLALVWVTFEALHNGRFDKKKGYEVLAPFSTLKELKQGDEVRMAGVKIGTVDKTRLANGRAEAVLNINPEIKIPSDALATISMAGLIGTNYISLTLGHAERGTVALGGTLQTKDAADLNQIMSDLGSLGQDLKGALGQIGQALGPGADGQGGLFQKIDRMVTENSSKISNTMTNLETITGKIRDGEGTIGKLVNDPSAYNELTSTLAEIRGAADQTKLFVSNTQGIIDQIKSGKGTIGTLIYDEETGSNLKYITKNLREVSDKLNNPNSTFGQLITNDNLIRDAQSTMRKVDRAVDGMSDQGPITAVGVVAGRLF